MDMTQTVKRKVSGSQSQLPLTGHMSIRRLRLIAFLGFLLLVAASVVVTLWALRTQQDDALVINLAGRQRMLIQQMRLEVLGVKIGASPVYRQSLEQTADAFEQTLNALAYGGEAPYTEGTTVTLPPTPIYETGILAQLEIVHATWNEMHPAIHAALQNDPQSTAFADAVATVERLSPVLLAQMDEAVRLYGVEAGRKVAFVQNVQLIFLAIAALQLIVSFVITERWVLGPIAQLVGAAQRIGMGDLGTPVSVIGLGELDRLARNLDEMRRKLGVGAEAQTALLGLSRRLLTAQDERDVAECAVEVAASALHAEFSALVLPDIDGRLLTNAVRGWPADFAGRFELGRSGASQTGYTILHGHPVAVEDYSTEAAFTAPPVIFEHGIVSGLSAPMLLEGQVVGAMLVHTRTQRQFGDDEIQLLLLIANQTAVALDKARLAAHKRRQVEELTVLYNIATIGVEATNVDALIEDAIQIIGDTLHPDYFGVGLVDEAADVLRVCRSTRTVRGERLVIPLGKGIAGKVIATGEPCRIPDVSREPAYMSVNPDTRSELCVPLKIGKHVIGLINIESGNLDAFSEADERLMTIFAGQLVTAIEKVRLFQSEQHHAQEAETLRQAGAVVASTLRQDEAIERILVQLERVVPYDSASVQLLGEGYVEIVGGRGWPDPAAVVGMRFPIPGDNPNTVVIQERRPHILGDAPSVHAAFREGAHSHIHSFLGVPLIVGDQVIGMLAVDKTQSNFFTQDHARLVAVFADQVALTIQNARLYAQAERRTDQLRALREVGHALSSELDLKAVLQALVEAAQQLAEARYAALAVIDEKGELAYFYTAGMTEAERQLIDALPHGLGLLGAILQERVPIRLAEIAGDPRSVGFPAKHPPMKTFLGVPIMARRILLGSLYLTEKKKEQVFTQEDEDLIVGLAADAAIAIERARLFGEVQQLASTDGLTGLHNRRHFMELAKREFGRARRYRRPLTAIMLDIDHFKQVNDTYGHAVGDKALKIVSERCRKTVRDIDILGRYGGDEFAALLLETDLDGARIVAERLCQCVAETPINTDSGTITITISVGVAILDKTCTGLDMLLVRADQALYVAKQAGGNRISIWQE